MFRSLRSLKQTKTGGKLEETKEEFLSDTSSAGHFRAEEVEKKQ
jgi:hypothetical protein